MCPDCESKFSLKKMFLALSIVLIGVFIADQYADASSQKNITMSNDEIIVYKMQ